MDDFTFYFGNGWNHIISIQALDHLLFLVALTAVYSIKNWKQLALLVTAFTIGHSLILALSVYDVLRFNTDWVEFLIPLSIVITCVYNLFISSPRRSIRFRYFMALVFGLVHGMGFANTLRFMLAREQSLGRPLLGFNLGIEAAQILVVLVLLIFHQVAVKKMRLHQNWWTYLLSTAAGAVALFICITRWPL